MSSHLIETARLTLIPSHLPLARAEIAERGEFSRLLGATVPANWPPESAADALPLFLSWMEAQPDRIGWFGWYAVDRSESILIGGGGFLGPPSHGTAQIGYSVLPQFQRRGFATETVSALLQWAIAQPETTRIIAETEWANPASVRVLEKTGFAPVAAPTEGDGMLYEWAPAS